MEQGTEKYRVHVGYTETGEDRWRLFDTFDEASRFCREVFQEKGVVLTIEEKTS